MKTKPILFTLAVLIVGASKSIAQDAGFTQWENISLHFNPALTGNFNGALRIRAIGQNQWESLLKDNSYRTSAVSAEYKFSTQKFPKVSIGLLAISNRGGSLSYRTNGIHLSTSVIQNLGNPDRIHHSIALGLNVGMTNIKLDLENAQWPGVPPTDLDDRTNYADVSTGLLWRYRSNTHFSFQLGSSLYHLNRPNISFSDTGNQKLYQRYHVHGQVEIPLIQQFSLIPSVLYSSKGPSGQVMLGINNRWYPNLLKTNFVQLGIFGKSAKNYDGWAFNVYAISAIVEMNSILVGFSFDRFPELESNTYEFSAGYILGMTRIKKENL